MRLESKKYLLDIQDAARLAAECVAGRHCQAGEHRATSSASTGTLELTIVKGMRKILVVPDDGGEARECSLPRGVHVNVQEGDRVSAGEPGNTHDILAVLGEKELQGYLVNVRLEGLPVAGRASTTNTSKWTSSASRKRGAASSISGKMDYLRGLKENVTMGRLIPTGTGFDVYRAVGIAPDEPPNAGTGQDTWRPDLSWLERSREQVRRTHRTDAEGMPSAPVVCLCALWPYKICFTRLGGPRGPAAQEQLPALASPG